MTNNKSKSKSNCEEFPAKKKKKKSTKCNKNLYKFAQIICVEDLNEGRKKTK